MSKQRRLAAKGSDSDAADTTRFADVGGGGSADEPAQLRSLLPAGAGRVGWSWRRTAGGNRHVDLALSAASAVSIWAACAPNNRGSTMKFGFRRPSLRRRIAARTSLKRYVRHSLGFKAPRGWGWLTNPKRAMYNRIYYRTTFGLGRGCLVMIVVAASTLGGAATLLMLILRGSAGG